MTFKVHNECPTCLNQINLRHNARAQRPPRTGDLCLCSKCGALNILNEILELETATEDQLEEKRKKDPALFAKAIAAQAEIRNRHR